MRAGSLKASWMCALLMMACLAGCLGGGGDGDGDNPISMNVHYDATSGVITERIQDGTVLSTVGVELSFDFARVTSKAGSMKTFSLDPGDDDEGINTVTENANEQAELAYTYLTHGLFTVVLSATDESNNTGSMEITVRIEKEIDWVQTNTNDPDRMIISTVPDCTCEHPEKISINSTVENPTDLLPNTQTTVTWSLLDPEENTEAFHTEQIGDGQEAAWTHNQYNVGSGNWALDVQIDAGNDSLNVQHLVTVLYAASESEPNPLDTASVEREDESV